MSSLLRHPRRFAATNPGLHITLDDELLRARARPCPGVVGMASVVVLDATTGATVEHYDRWRQQLGLLGFAHLRTGALSPRHAASAEEAGLQCVQRLALLEWSPPPRSRPPRSRPPRSTIALNASRLGTASLIDQAAFGLRWWLDDTMLSEVCMATPRFRARLIDGRESGLPGGFVISGRAGRTGYIQRLAVHPDEHRNGLASALLVDSLRWMQRNRVGRVFVNTHVDNEPALALYRANGFVALRDELAVFEGVIPR